MHFSPFSLILLHSAASLEHLPSRKIAIPSSIPNFWSEVRYDSLLAVVAAL